MSVADLIGFFVRLWIRFRSRWVDPMRARFVLREEHRLLSAFPRPEVEDTSGVFFSMHRSGSSLVHRVLRERARAEGLRTVNLARYFTLAGRSLDAAFESEAWRERVFSPRGYYYGVFRRMRPVPELDRFQVLLLLRDPRDVLTSQFFSLTRGHRMMSADHYDRRRRARRMDIDAFVLDRASDWRQRYREYVRYLFGRPTVLLVRYEDLIDDFSGHWRTIVDHMGWGSESAPAVPAVDFTVEREDPRAHKRQVGWGDHRDKLKPGTVRHLNRTFEGILDELGYPEAPKGAGGPR